MESGSHRLQALGPFPGDVEFQTLSPAADAQSFLPSGCAVLRVSYSGTSPVQRETAPAQALRTGKSLVIGPELKAGNTACAT